ncbi:MAG: hypothetical protein DRP56_04140 [Planctomycetota bacterium]|nr:MAG: hypothetical protein DRP56_04140 [Planctomycetota bacterium]
MVNWLHNGMEQDARRIEVWMPNIKNPQEMKEFRGKVQKFLDKNHVTQKELGDRCGVSVTTINLFLKGKYKGDLKKLTQTLTDYINRFDRRSRREKGSGYIETSVAKAITTVIKNTETFTEPSEGKVSVIVGDAGHGKSKCLQEYTKQHLNSIYIKLHTSISGKAMFAKIAEALGLDRHATLDKLKETIGDHLAKREMTVLLDECSGLGVRQLDLLRQIITENGCTLILAGNGHLLNTINQPTTRHGYECMDQLRSRMLRALNLDEVAADGDGGLYTIDDIRKLYDYGGIRLSKNGADTLKQMCRTPQTGRLRTCSVVVAALHNSKQAKNGKLKEISQALIISAIEQLGLPVASLLPMVIGRANTVARQTAAKTA